MTRILNVTLKIKILKVVTGFNWANTAPLKAMHKMVTKKSNIIFKIMSIVPIKSTIAAAEPRQLCPIIAMLE